MRKNESFLSIPPSDVLDFTANDTSIVETRIILARCFFVADYVAGTTAFFILLGCIATSDYRVDLVAIIASVIHGLWNFITQISSTLGSNVI